MDLSVYYQKLRQIEAGLLGQDVVVLSKATPDGGRPGVLTEVPRSIAAKLLLEGSAEVAAAEVASSLRKQVAEAKRVADLRAAANRLQVTVVAEEHVKRPAAESDD